MNNNFYNKTRVSQSIVKKLLKQGRIHLIPLYYLLRLSYLAREGMENSGSYKFADHVYVSKPKGSFLVGKLLDKILLSLPSARSMRNRYVKGKETIEDLAKGRDRIRLLLVPSGLGREWAELVDQIDVAEWHLMDLDANLIGVLEENGSHLKQSHFHVGDAMNVDHYPEGEFDLVLSTGFVDFLDDDQALDFFKIVWSRLRKGGYFYTSGMMMHKPTEYLMRNLAELKVTYRSPEDLEKLTRMANFESIEVTKDEYGIQVIVLAKK